MRSIRVIGMGTGNPEHLTLEAIRALRSVAAVFVPDKGTDKEELIRMRREVCALAFGERPYRFVEIADPPRERQPTDYTATVEAWHAARAELYEAAIARWKARTASSNAQ